MISQFVAAFARTRACSMIVAICLLSSLTARADSPTIDLLEQPAAAQQHSPFDLLERIEPSNVVARSLRDRASESQSDSATEIGCPPECDDDKAILPINLLQLTPPPPAPKIVAAPKVPVTPKPIVRMKSASWCVVCVRAKKEIAAAKDCPFELLAINDEQCTTPLPSFEWTVAGKLWTTSDPKTGKERPGYYGYADLLANWKATQPAKPAAPAAAPAPEQPTRIATK